MGIGSPGVQLQGGMMVLFRFVYYPKAMVFIDEKYVLKRCEYGNSQICRNKYKLYVQVLYLFACFFHSKPLIERMRHVIILY